MPLANTAHLVRNRSGYHSIRVNQQWRIVFCLEGNGDADVQFVDYH